METTRESPQRGRTDTVSKNRWIFGIDGGGTSSRLRIESLEGAPLYMSVSSSLNPRSVGWTGVSEVLEKLFYDLYAGNSFRPEDCAGGFAGLAGIGRISDRGKALGFLRKASRATCPIDADNDALPALVGALGSRRGILLIAGTGSIAVGAAADGTLIRSGGWGHILGDEGSAYDVGRNGLAAALAYRDGRGPATILLDLALEHFGVSEPFDLIPAVYEKFDKSVIAGFARSVVEARNRNDSAATAVVDEAARRLGQLVESVARQTGGEAEGRRVVFAGGFLENVEALREGVVAYLAGNLPDFHVVPPIADAAVGACSLARELARQGNSEA